MNICKKLCKRLGGTIIIDSIEGQGSCFTLKLSINFFNSNSDSVRVQQFNPNTLSSKIKFIEKDKIQLRTSKTNLFLRGSSRKNKMLDFSDSNREINKKPLIIVADDETGNRKVFSSDLKKLNLSHFEAKNGLEALELVKSKITPNSIDEYVLIFIDSNMPIMNGEESSIKIRQYLKEINAMPPSIICVTANAEANQKGPLNEIY